MTSDAICFFCAHPPSDVIGAGVPDSPAEPSLQVFSAGKDRGVEGSIRVPLQGFAGTEDEQEAGKNTGGSLLCFCTDAMRTLRGGLGVCATTITKSPLALCGAGVSFHSARLPVIHNSIESRIKASKARTWQRCDL